MMLRRTKLGFWGLALAFALMLTGSITAAVRAQDDGVGLREAERSVVRIVVLHLGADDAPVAIMAGSGFVVAPGKVVTNNHVIEAPVGAVRTIYYVIPDRFAGDERKAATLGQTWPDADLALLDAPELSAPALKIAASPPGKEALVRALGYPGVTDRMRKLPLEQSLKPSEPYVTSGSIALFSDTAPGGGAFDTIFHTAPIDHGNSGGPLLDECARVIGVNTWSASDNLASDGTVESHPGQFASIRSSVVSRFLERAGVATSIDYSPCVRAVPVDAALLAQVDKANAAASAAVAAARRAEIERDRIVRGGMIVLVLLAGAGVALLLWSRRPKSIAPPQGGAAVEPAVGGPAAKSSSMLPTLATVGLAVAVTAVVTYWIATHHRTRASAATPGAAASVALNCRFVPAKSFNALPQAGSLKISFDPAALCVNGRTPYEKVGQSFMRVTLSENGHGASRLDLSPDLRTFTRRDFALSEADYLALAASRKSAGPVSCPVPGDDSSAKTTADALARTRTLSAAYFTTEPSRVMVWRCEPKSP